MRKLVWPDELPANGIRYCNRHRLRLEREGLFPKRIRFGRGQKFAYSADEIAKYVDQCIAARDLAT